MTCQITNRFREKGERGRGKKQKEKGRAISSLPLDLLPKMFNGLSATCSSRQKREAKKGSGMLCRKHPQFKLVAQSLHCA